MKRRLSLCNLMDNDNFKGGFCLFIKSANAEYFLKLGLQGRRRAIINLIPLLSEEKSDGLWSGGAMVEAIDGAVAIDVVIDFLVVFAAGIGNR